MEQYPQLYQPHPPYTLPCNEQGYRTTHTCELCGYEPKTKNKYREKQDHLVMKHFKEQVERDFSRSHIPYLCPTEGCGFEAKDKQGLLRHYTGKHRVIEAYLQQALAAKGVVLLPQAGVKRRRSSGVSETSGTSETSDMGTADQDKKAHPVYPGQQAGYNGYQGKIQGYGTPGVAVQGYGTPGVGVHGAPGVGLHPAPGSAAQGYGAPGGNNRSYLPHTVVAGGERSSVYQGQASGGEGGRYRMVQGAGYLMPGGMYLGGQGRAPPVAHQYQGGGGLGRAPSVGGGLHPWRTTQPNAGRRPVPVQHTLPDPVKIKKEVEAMMASFGLRAFEDPPVATSVTPTPHQQYATPSPSPKEYVAPSPQHYASPSPQEYVSPSPQDYVTPSPQEYVTPSPQEYVSPSSQDYVTPSPQEYVNPSPQQYVQPPQKSPQEYVSPSPQYVHPSQKSPQEYVSPSPQYVHPPQKSPQEYVHPSPQYVQPPQTSQDYVHHPQGSPQEQVDSSPQVYVHSPQESPQEYAPPTSQDEYTHHSKTSPYPPSSTSIPSPYVATSPYTPPDSQPHTPESSSSDPLEAPTAPTITPKLEPEWS